MNASHLSYINSLNNVEAMLRRGIPTAKTGVRFVDWLNGVCLKLADLYDAMHRYMQEPAVNKETVEMILLCLRQMAVCISYLEKVAATEEQSRVKLMMCREHFIDRMIWCCNRLSAAVKCDQNKTLSDGTGDNFVESMDMALELLEPLSMYPNCTTSQSTDFTEKSSIIRSAIEQLICHTLAFVCVAAEQDKEPLTTLSHKLMQACMDFDKTCDPSKCTSEDEKRMKVVHVQYAIQNLNKLVNQCLLRLFFIVCTELNENPVAQLQSLKTSNAAQIELDGQVEKFDDTLDRMLQIGVFVMAYSQQAKVKTNMKSCLSSCEAVGSDLIAAILSSNHDMEAKFLAEHWNDSATIFRRCTQDIIDTTAFCSILVDILDEAVSSLRNRANNVNDVLRNALHRCDIFREHIQQNDKNLRINEMAAFQLHFDDFKMMINEAKASLKSTSDVSRLCKRFGILLAVVRNIETSLESCNVGKGNSVNVTNTSAIENKLIALDLPHTAHRDNFDIATDLDRFISRNGSTMHESIFYGTRMKSCRVQTFAGHMNSIKAVSSARKDRMPMHHMKTSRLFSPGSIQ